MVKYVPRQELDFVFASLSDPTRREILSRIAEVEILKQVQDDKNQGLTVTEIAKPYKISLPAVSKHLKILERASLIHRQKHGREYLVSLNAEPLKEASRYLSFYRQFWNSQFDSLEKYLGKSKK